jgi:hypothetical protein
MYLEQVVKMASPGRDLTQDCWAERLQKVALMRWGDCPMGRLLIKSPKQKSRGSQERHSFRNFQV